MFAPLSGIQVSVLFLQAFSGEEVGENRGSPFRAVATVCSLVPDVPFGPEETFVRVETTRASLSPDVVEDSQGRQRVFLPIFLPVCRSSSLRC